MTLPLDQWEKKRVKHLKETGEDLRKIVVSKVPGLLWAVSSIDMPDAILRRIEAGQSPDIRPAWPKWRQPLIVFGSRLQDNSNPDITIMTRENFYRWAVEELDMLTLNYKECVVISGCAPGGDFAGEIWAARRKFYCVRFAPHVKTYGSPRAYHVRNRDMAKYGKKVGAKGIAFWDGTSPGTKSMIGLCEKYGIEVKVVRIR